MSNNEIETPIAADAGAPAEVEGRHEQRVPMSRLRERIAQRLLESRQQTAPLTVCCQVCMAAVEELCGRLSADFEREHGTPLPAMGFFVKAAVCALRKHPLVNASIDGSTIVYHGYFDIAVAVPTERGTAVPVIRNADQMTFPQIALKVADLVGRAHRQELGIGDLTGGTFTLADSGPFGAFLSTPVLNPPQVASLGIHAVEDRPVALNGEVVVRPMSYLALTYDSRLIDEREAVAALAEIKAALEDPARLLLDL